MEEGYQEAEPSPTGSSREVPQPALLPDMVQGSGSYRLTQTRCSPFPRHAHRPSSSSAVGIFETPWSLASEPEWKPQLHYVSTYDLPGRREATGLKNERQVGGPALWRTLCLSSQSPGRAGPACSAEWTCDLRALGSLVPEGGSKGQGPSERSPEPP